MCGISLVAATLEEGGDACAALLPFCSYLWVKAAEHLLDQLKEIYIKGTTREQLKAQCLSQTKTELTKLTKKNKKKRERELIQRTIEVDCVQNNNKTTELIRSACVDNTYKEQGKCEGRSSCCPNTTVSCRLTHDIGLGVRKNRQVHEKDGGHCIDLNGIFGPVSVGMSVAVHSFLGKA